MGLASKIDGAGAAFHNEDWTAMSRIFVQTFVK